MRVWGFILCFGDSLFLLPSLGQQTQEELFLRGRGGLAVHAV